MDLAKIPLFAALGKRMEWLNQRQKVLAENVANANTPNYRSSDLAPQSFRDLLKGAGGGRLVPVATSSGHLGGVPRGAGAMTTTRDKVIEISPTGNAVQIEEQMMKVAETQADYTMTTNLYRKHLNMLKTAIGRAGGG